PARLAVGTSGQLLKSQGSGSNVAWADPLAWKYTSSKSITGTAIDFTDIPDGVTVVDIYIAGASPSADTSSFLVQLRTSARVVSADYSGRGLAVSGTSASANGVANSSGFNIVLNDEFDGANSYVGVIKLRNFGSNLWVVDAAGSGDTTTFYHGDGDVSLSEAL